MYIILLSAAYLSTLEGDGDVKGDFGQVGGAHLHVEGPSTGVEEDLLGALTLGNGAVDILEALASVQVEHVALGDTTDCQLHPVSSGLGWKEFSYFEENMEFGRA